MKITVRGMFYEDKHGCPGTGARQGTGSHFCACYAVPANWRECRELRGQKGSRQRFRTHRALSEVLGFVSNHVLLGLAVLMGSSVSAAGGGRQRPSAAQALLLATQPPWSLPFSWLDAAFAAWNAVRSAVWSTWLAAAAVAAAVAFACRCPLAACAASRAAASCL